MRRHVICAAPYAIGLAIGSWLWFAEPIPRDLLGAYAIGAATGIACGWILWGRS